MLEPAYLKCETCRKVHPRRCSQVIVVQQQDSVTNKDQNVTQYFCSLDCVLHRCYRCHRKGILFYRCCENSENQTDGICSKLMCLQCVFFIREQNSRIADPLTTHIVCLDCEAEWQQNRNTVVHTYLVSWLAIPEIIGMILSFLPQLPQNQNNVPKRTPE